MSRRAVSVITKAVTKLYPRELADSSWDNTGLLLEASTEDRVENENIKLLLAIDLTTSVTQEAIDMNASMIVAYHPIIFRGLKSITTKDSQQRSLLRLTAAGISVYCPHTAVDAAVGGVNDWLADGISGGRDFELSRSVIEKVEGVAGFEGAGMGRIVALKEEISIYKLVERVKKLLGLDHVQLALAPNHKHKDVKSVALCAGSGGSVLRGAKADVYFTGELGHHEALALVESGISAIVCGHSNTERGFLVELKKQLASEFAANSESVEIEISQTDKDPLVTV